MVPGPPVALLEGVLAYHIGVVVVLEIGSFSNIPPSQAATKRSQVVYICLPPPSFFRVDLLLHELRELLCGQGAPCLLRV